MPDFPSSAAFPSDADARPDDFPSFRRAVAASFVPLRVTSDDVTGFHGAIRAAGVGGPASCAHVPVPVTPGQLVERSWNGQ